MEPHELIGAAALAALVSGALTPACARLARRFRMLDAPGRHRGHAEPTPLLGGVAVIAGAAMATVLVAGRLPATDRVPLGALAAGALVVALVGLVDDARRLTAARKLAFQLAAVATLASLLVLTGGSAALSLERHGAVTLTATALWVVAMVNALNFVDNMNGLCAGIAVVSGAGLSAVAWASGLHGAALAAAATAGACAGFLPFNYPRASVFLGDAGSMAIGLALGSTSAFCVLAHHELRQPGVWVLAPLLVLAVPAVDMLTVIALRLARRRAPWSGDRCHLSHRLVRRGLSPAAAVAVLWCAAALCAAASVALVDAGAGRAYWLLAGAGLALAALVAAAGTRGLD